jgi:hypothetical protein
MDVDVFCWTISREMGFVRDDFREVNVPYSTSTSPDASRTAWIRGHRRASKCLGVGSDVMAVVLVGCSSGCRTSDHIFK